MSQSSAKCCVCGRQFGHNWRERNLFMHMKRHVDAGQATMAMILTPEGIFSHYEFRKVERRELAKS